MRRKNNRIHPAVVTLLVAALCLVSIGGIVLFSRLSAPAQPELPPEPPQDPVIESSAAPEPAPPPQTVHFMAAGDNLIHDIIYTQAASRTGGTGFDFTPVYEHTRGMFDTADVSFLNQETIIAEKLFPLSGYPQFNSPEALGNTMVDMGFDLIHLANNHMLDMGEAGLYAALEFWNSKRGQGVLPFGAWETKEAMNQPILYEKNGITFGIVPVTEHTNGLRLPADTKLRYLLSSEIEEMHRQVELAKQAADFVILSIHWGTESSNDTNENQRHLAGLFTEWGVDLVLGHHSHTLQPMEWQEGADGHRTLVVYSLGNYISAMLYPQHMLGGVLDLDIQKTDGKAEISRAAMLPIITHYDSANRWQVRNYRFEDYTEALANEHGVKVKHPELSIPYFADIIRKNIPEEFRPQLPL